VALLRGAAIKLDTVRMVCLAWADELVARDASADLETLMGDVPKDSARIVVTAELTPAVEALLERYARRARRTVTATSDTDQPMNVEYLAVSAPARLSALRRILDASDPKSAVVFVRDHDSELEVRDLLRALGYAGEAAAIKVGRVSAPGTELALLFDLPASREELREAGGGAERVVAIVQPRQLASLRALAAGGQLKPITLPDATVRARDRDNRVRAELRAGLESRQFGRELLMLEPLLDEFDGIEVAAVAVQLLERDRAAREQSAPQASAAPRERSEGEMVRLFVNVGTRDGARASDLVGAIATQAAIDSSDIGKVDIRESHSVVEVSASVANDVIERVTGTSIRGRRAVVRKDEERPTRPERDKDRGPRGGGGGRGRPDATRAPRGRTRE
jgi:ATP-dependent RNA helicase DeaD